MLSEKKMVIGQSSIDFLGVNISDGKYTLQPHIATSLREFPDKLTSAKQKQQFLGIVNYMSDFIPKVSRYRNCLAQLLKKSPPKWNSTHTEAVQQLKRLSKKLPPLQIPEPGKRILQIDEVMNIGQQPFLKRLMEKGVFVAIKVVHSSLQNFTTTLLSKKFLQSNMELKIFSSISLDIIFWQKWTCLPFLRCFSSKGKCSHIPSYSNGQIDFHNSLFKSSTLKVKITLSLITFLGNLQSLIPLLFLHPCVYVLLQIHPHPQALPLQILMIPLA